MITNKINEMTERLKQAMIEEAKAMPGYAKSVAKQAGQAAANHGRKQANSFIDGMKHEVLGVKRSTK